MPGLFDHLQSHLDDDEPGGITPLDIAELPADQKTMMLALLREQGSSADGMTLDELRGRFKDKIGDLERTLAELTQKGWLIVMGESPKLTYRVNLRAKRGSGADFGLWSIISDRVKNPKESKNG